MSNANQYPYLKHVKSLLEQVQSFCRRHHLFSPGPVVVAVSGGADSLTLLHMLIQLQKDLDITLHVATFDHGIRGEAGANDVNFVKDIARQWGVSVTSGYADVPLYTQQNKLGTEAAARKLRYEFLFDVARQNDTNTIAVGHNEDDQAETVLMHLLRGSGLKGLRGMLPKTQLKNGLHIVRPLIQLNRTAIDIYINSLNVIPRNDETNKDTNYDRNSIRHVIIPFLERKGYGHIKKTLVRLADITYEDYEALQACLPNFQISSDTHTVEFTRGEFISLLAGQQRTLIRNAVEQVDADGFVYLSFRNVEIIRNHIIQNQKFSERPMGGGSVISSNGEIISISRETRKRRPIKYPDNCPSLQATEARLLHLSIGTYPLRGKWHVSIEQIDDHPDITTLTNAAPYSITIAVQPGSALQFRTRQHGDRFKPHGMGGKSQKLQDTFVNMGVPAEYRDQVPLLVVNDEIAWFIAPTKSGVRSRIAETFAVQDNDEVDDREFWRITFLKT